MVIVTNAGYTVGDAVVHDKPHLIRACLIYHESRRNRVASGKHSQTSRGQAHKVPLIVEGVPIDVGRVTAIEERPSLPHPRSDSARHLPLAENSEC